MKLAIMVRPSFASRRERHGVHCLCTPVVSMVSGKFPKMQCQVLSILIYFKEFEFGSGDGTMENCKGYMSLTVKRKGNAWQSEAAIAEEKRDHHPRATKPFKYHVNHVIPLT
jgi:hypothetical protein